MKFRLTLTSQRSATALILIALPLLIRGVAHAADAAAFAAPIAAPAAPAPGFSRVAFSLLLVLGLLLGGAWLMKRVSGLARGSNPRLRLLANLPLATRERAVLIEVDGREVLLGVAPGSVRTLLVCEPRGGIAPSRANSGGSNAEPGDDAVAKQYADRVGASAGSAAHAPDFKTVFRDVLRRSLGR